MGSDFLPSFLRAPGLHITAACAGVALQPRGSLRGEEDEEEAAAGNGGARRPAGGSRGGRQVSPLRRRGAALTALSPCALQEQMHADEAERAVRSANVVHKYIFLSSTMEL